MIKFHCRLSGKALTSNPFPPCDLEVPAAGGSPMALTRVIYGLGRRLWEKPASPVGRGNVTLGAVRNSIWEGSLHVCAPFPMQYKSLPCLQASSHLPWGQVSFISFVYTTVPALCQRLFQSAGTIPASPGCRILLTFGAGRAPALNGLFVLGCCSCWKNLCSLCFLSPPRGWEPSQLPLPLPAEISNSATALGIFWWRAACVSCPVPPSPLPECAGRVFPGDRLPINPGCAPSSRAPIYRQEEAELIQGNSCFSRIWNLNSLLQQVSSIRWCFTATVVNSRMLSWG